MPNLYQNVYMYIYIYTHVYFYLICSIMRYKFHLLARVDVWFHSVLLAPMRVADFSGRKSPGDVRPPRQEQSNVAVEFAGVRVGIALCWILLVARALLQKLWLFTCPWPSRQRYPKIYKTDKRSSPLSLNCFTRPRLIYSWGTMQQCPQT